MASTAHLGPWSCFGRASSLRLRSSDKRALLHQASLWTWPVRTWALQCNRAGRFGRWTKGQDDMINRGTTPATYVYYIFLCQDTLTSTLELSDMHVKQARSLGPADVLLHTHTWRPSQKPSHSVRLKPAPPVPAGKNNLLPPSPSPPGQHAPPTCFRPQLAIPMDIAMSVVLSSPAGETCTCSGQLHITGYPNTRVPDFYF
jgi:hypothetical protein